MSSKNVLVKNIAYLGIVQVCNYLLPLISVPVISRILGPTKFGVINYCAAIVSYFTLLIAFGFDLSATRKISRDPQNLTLRNQIFNEVFSAQCFLLFVSLLLFCVLLQINPILKAERLVAIFSFLICLSTVITQNWLFQAMQDLSKVAFWSFVAKLLFTVSVLLVVKKRSDYLFQPLVLSLSQIAISVISFLVAINRYQLKFKFVRLSRIFKLLLAERTIFFSLVVISFYTTTNVVILGLYKSELEVGYFTASQRLILVASSLINLPFVQALYPYIGKAFGSSKDAGMQAVQKIFPVVLIVSILAGIVLFFLGPFVLENFYGLSFRPSSKSFKIMAFVPALVAVSSVFGIQIMLNLKMDKLFFSITFAGAILGLFLNFVLVKRFGYLGTSWNWLVVEIFITVVMYLVLLRKNIHPLKLDQFSLKNLKKISLSIIKPNYRRD